MGKTKIPFSKRILQKKIIVGDGALGTYLNCGEISAGTSIESLNLSNPGLVKKVHEEYINAGAEVIETNTYCANRYKLEQHGLDKKVTEINLKGAQIAVQAAGDSGVYVGGAIGPIGRTLEPVSVISFEDVKEVFKEQAEALIDGGIDFIIIETFANLMELRAAVEAVREISDVPILAQKTYFEDGRTLMGELPVQIVRFIEGLNVDILGANCTVGPQRMVEIIERMAGKSNLRLSAQPTAGLPQQERGRMVYNATPEYFAEYAVAMVEAGAFYVGGCCGTTPAHIKAVADRIKGKEVVERTVVSVEKIVEKEKAAVERKPSRFLQKIRQRNIFTAELDLPRGLELSSVLKGAKFLKEAGYDSVNISDGARARLRISPIVMSHIVERDVGIDVILHFTCRDRNLLGLQSELLGARALGLQNILAITGDPTAIGDYPAATSVFDVDSIGLVRIIKKLNEAEDLGGNDIKTPTDFTICVAGNPMAEDLSKELVRLEQKVEEGADVVFTQPIYDRRYLDSFIAGMEEFSVPVLAGILPLRSSRHAEFLHNEVPGIVIPEETRARMRKASEKNPKEAWKTGVDIAREFIDSILIYVNGGYLMPPFEKYEMATLVTEPFIEKK